MAKNDLRSLNPLDFLKVTKERQSRFDNAPATPIPAEYPVNALARRLHPDRQFVKITDIIDRASDCKSFVFSPDPERGTEELAYFAAGKYISVYLNIDGMPVTRAYSLSSSPKDSLGGRYEITIKYAQDGLASCYMLDNWKVGDEVEISAPEGSFEYVSLRDAATVVCLAGGSGITPCQSVLFL